MNMNIKNRTRGFSLVELSVVLVVIGIIVGGITAGGYVLRAMRIKSMVSQSQDYRGALLNFSTIYQGLPGDLINASTFFNPSIPALPQPSDGDCDYSGLTSMNGNGDDKIEPDNESALAVLHLSLAEVTKNTYCGVWGGAYDIGVNVIRADIDKGAAMRIGCCADSNYSRGADFKNHFTFFTLSPLDTAERAGVLSPSEAQELDIKLDDGLPDAGFVVAEGVFNGSGYGSAGCYKGEEGDSLYLTPTDDAVAHKNKFACQVLFKYD